MPTPLQNSIYQQINARNDGIAEGITWVLKQDNNFNRETFVAYLKSYYLSYGYKTSDYQYLLDYYEDFYFNAL